MRQADSNGWFATTLQLTLKQIGSLGNFKRFAIVMTTLGILAFKVLGADAWIPVLVLVFGAMWTVLLARYLKVE
jgi:hypothetical protein